MIIDKGQWEQTELVEDGLDWNFEMEKMEYNPKSMFGDVGEKLSAFQKYQTEACLLLEQIRKKKVNVSSQF